MAHYNGGMYDVGFNSPPEFGGPMSNRSDMSETDKRASMLHRQQSGIASPSGMAHHAIRVFTFHFTGYPFTKLSSQNRLTPTCIITDR